MGKLGWFMSKTLTTTSPPREGEPVWTVTLRETDRQTDNYRDKTEISIEDNFLYSNRMRKLLRISYLEHKTNDWVRSKIDFLVGPQESLLATVKRRQLAWFGHITRHGSLSKTNLQDTLEGWRRRGRQRKCWMNNINDETSLPMPELQERLERDLG